MTDRVKTFHAVVTPEKVGGVEIGIPTTPLSMASRLYGINHSARFE